MKTKLIYVKNDKNSLPFLKYVAIIKNGKGIVWNEKGVNGHYHFFYTNERQISVFITMK